LTTGTLADYKRLQARQMHPTINPPVITSPYEDNPANGPICPSFVPKVDGDDIAGIRLPELTVPLATYTGWRLRSAHKTIDFFLQGDGRYARRPFFCRSDDRRSVPAAC
jgi:hypothetical protein